MPQINLPFSGALTLLAGSGITLTPSGSNILTISASAFAGTLPIVNGGTGQTTANTALNALLPNQTSNANKFLQTDGTNSSWQTGGGTPTGTANTVAYFDNSGNLNSHATFFLDSTANSLAFYTTVSGGTVVSNAAGSLAFGFSDASNIQAIATASVAFGHASGVSAISAGSEASMSFGQTSGGSVIANGAAASVAFGVATGGAITTNGAGALSYGSTNAGSSIDASGVGSQAFGVCSGAAIHASGNGSQAFGVTNAANIFSTSDGSLAFGSAVSGGITASGRGSLAHGVTLTADIVASGDGSLAEGDDLNVTAQTAQGFGVGHVNNTYLTAVFGRYSVSPAGGNETTWVGTDPLFVIGNGANSGARNNAIEMSKDGKLVTSASIKNTAIRVITGTDTLSARTDYKAVLNAGAGAFNLNLPVGEDGLTFFLVEASTNAGVFTVVPNGGDTLDASVQSLLASNAPTPITFIGGAWYTV